MEGPNWRCLHDVLTRSVQQKHEVEKLSPCFVKVSHHGSRTAVINGMWQPGRGFMEALQPSGRAYPKCVITPWQQAGRKLPDQTVTTAITASGCHLWETGRYPNVSTLDRATFSKNSFVRFSIDGRRNDATFVGGEHYRHSPPAT